ncbi:MAG: hypothetical protein Q7R96_01475, partial [Nanoarchaeota archaeon]|nr:hypothetical protein [Nanoarchaeota archaeon]
PSDGANLTATNGTTDSVSGRVSVTTNTTTNITNVTVYLLTSGNASLAVLYTNTTTDQQNVSFNFSFAVASYSNSVRNLTLYAEVKAADAGGAGANLTGVDTNVNITIINTVTVAIVSPSNSTNQTAGSLTMNMSHTTTIDALEIISYPLTCTFLSSGANASITNTSRISGNHTVFINASMTERLHKLRGTCVDATTGAVGNSPLIDFTRDATAPFNANMTLSSASVGYGKTVTLTCIGADAVSNLSNATLSVQPAGLSGFRTVAFNFTTNNASIEYADTNELGTYDANCTITDYTGNQNSSTVSFEVVKVLSDQVYVPSAKPVASKIIGSGKTVDVGVLEVSDARLMAKGAKIIFSVNDESHSVMVVELTRDAVTLEVASDPQEVVLKVGDSQDVDLNGDGVFDVSIKLNGIFRGKADLEFTNLKNAPAEVSTEQPTQEEPAVIENPPLVSPAAKKSIFIVLLVIAVVLVLVYLFAKMRQRKQGVKFSPKDMGMSSSYPSYPKQPPAPQQPVQPRTLSQQPAYTSQQPVNRSVQQPRASPQSLLYQGDAQPMRRSATSLPASSNANFSRLPYNPGNQKIVYKRYPER